MTRWLILTVALLALWAVPANAALHDVRVALIVANAAYEDAPLKNPTVDADLIYPALKAMGFDVTVVKNADLEAFALALGAFYADAESADVALFYFAGHGFALDGALGAENYLMSTSANVTSNLDVVIRSGGLSLDEIVASITTTAKISLVFVDACRNDPRVSRGTGSGRGLARIVDVGTEEVFVGLSTRLGSLADDGEAGNGSPFARAFAEHMPTPHLPIGEAFRLVRLAVIDETGGRQRPEARDDLNSALVVVESKPETDWISGVATAGQETEQAPTPVPSVALVEEPIDQGVLYNNTGRDALAPLNIVTNPDRDYFVKLIDVTTGENAMGIFVRGGSVAEFEVPLGSYEVRYASGLTWYGLGDLFGPETSYAKAAETFAFTEDADGYVGYTLTLIMQEGGNLDTQAIDPSDFGATIVPAQVHEATPTEPPNTEFRTLPNGVIVKIR